MPAAQRRWSAARRAAVNFSTRRARLPPVTSPSSLGLPSRLFELLDPLGEIHQLDGLDRLVEHALRSPDLNGGDAAGEVPLQRINRLRGNRLEAPDSGFDDLTTGGAVFGLEGGSWSQRSNVDSLIPAFTAAAAIVGSARRAVIATSSCRSRLPRPVAVMGYHWLSPR